MSIKSIRMKNNISGLICAILAVVLTTACNKEDVIESDVHRPSIILDSETGIYTVKTGRTLTLSPIVEHATPDTEYAWIEDGVVIASTPALTVSYPEPRTVYLTFTATNEAGSAREDIRIEVMEKTPPVISLALPEGGLTVQAGTAYVFTPDIQHADEPGFEIEWFRDGEVVCNELTYTFFEETPGTYPVTVKARNEDGEDSKEFIVTVTAGRQAAISFPTQSFFSKNTDRTAVVGRPIILMPFTEGLEGATFRWLKDGEEMAGVTTRSLKFTPAAAGTHTFKVIASDGMKRIRPLTRNVSDAGMRLEAEVTVHVYADEDAYLRRGGAQMTQNRVFEYIPAPGQFINERTTGGFPPADITTHEQAIEYALNRLKEGRFVSLGGFGGYIVVGFDHSIMAGEGEYDFMIQGNSFEDTNGASNEPGIVWVMQDTNGNGIPDDEWYELRGSESGASTTLLSYAVTYFRPAGPQMDVVWTDSQGNTGRIAYLKMLRTQDYYYPMWVSHDSYTLRGTRLRANNERNEATGQWNNHAFGWGYADNAGTDTLPASFGTGQRTGFSIANAVNSDGTPVALSHIDFIKVQTACNTSSGNLGENSTEVFSFEDL